MLLLATLDGKEEFYVKKYIASISSYGHPKNTAEAKRSSVGCAQRRENTVAVDYCASTARNSTGEEIKTLVENTKRKHQFRTK